MKRQQPIGFDLLVNGLRCRQTEAQWSFDYLYDHSRQQGVSGGTVTTTGRVIDGAVLVTAKLHSGPETDLRDVLAAGEEIDLDAVTPHLRRGDDDALREHLVRGLEILENDEFKHGFGVTSEPQLFQKRLSPRFKSICLRRLTT